MSIRIITTIHPIADAEKPYKDISILGSTITAPATSLGLYDINAFSAMKPEAKINYVGTTDTSNPAIIPYYGLNTTVKYGKDMLAPAKIQITAFSKTPYSVTCRIRKPISFIGTATYTEGTLLLVDTFGNILNQLDNVQLGNTDPLWSDYLTITLPKPVVTATLVWKPTGDHLIHTAHNLIHKTSDTLNYLYLDKSELYPDANSTFRIKTIRPDIEFNTVSMSIDGLISIHATTNTDVNGVRTFTFSKLTPSLLDNTIAFIEVDYTLDGGSYKERLFLEVVQYIPIRDADTINYASAGIPIGLPFPSTYGKSVLVDMYSVSYLNNELISSYGTTEMDRVALPFLPAQASDETYYITTILDDLFAVSVLRQGSFVLYTFRMSYGKFRDIKRITAGTDSLRREPFDLGIGSFNMDGGVLANTLSDTFSEGKGRRPMSAYGRDIYIVNRGVTDGRITIDKYNIDSGARAQVLKLPLTDGHAKFLTDIVISKEGMLYMVISDKIMKYDLVANGPASSATILLQLLGVTSSTLQAPFPIKLGSSTVESMYLQMYHSDRLVIYVNLSSSTTIQFADTTTGAITKLPVSAKYKKDLYISDVDSSSMVSTGIDGQYMLNKGN